MAEAAAAPGLPSELSKRFERYRAEVARLVAEGIEHPNFELKRSASISRDNLADRLDFIKLIQGLANTDGAEEKFIIVGADQKERRFYPLANADEFDPAKLTQVVAKYLDPPPRLEVFSNVQIEGGGSYVLIVLGPDQPRPIVAVCEGTSQRRTHFRQGDIWTKKGTSLQLAVRADLDAMYEQHINTEAETRARRRFKHFQEELRSGLVPQPAVTAPSRELLVGARKDLHAFAELAISGADVGRLKMLLEMAREQLVEGWEVHEANGPGMPQDAEAWIAEIAEFYRDGFIPSLESAVELGLQIIKYDAPVEWLGLVVETLVEAFETCRRLDRLRSGALGGRPDTLPFARPAYETYIGMRALATHAVRRKRFHFLGSILPRFVRAFTVDNQSQVSVPLIFWPFSDSLRLPDMRGGRNRTLWNERIQSAWAPYFGTSENFFAAASQLEFILEFNSYVFVTVRNPEIDKLRQTLGNRCFDYVPDFWATRLDETVPIADRFYDMLAGDRVPPEFAIDKQAIELVLRGKSARERLLLLGGFLAHLTAWQATAMRQFNRFPFMFDWPGRLNDIRDAYKESKKASETKR